MGWNKARQSVRERMAANRRRYNEAPLRDSLEQQAIRALAERKPVSQPVFCKDHFRPVERNGETRWLLLPDCVAALNYCGSQPGPAMYCRACGEDMADGAPRLYFKFRWVNTDNRQQSGAVHSKYCLPEATEI
jgi:hypothetical protein